MGTAQQMKRAIEEANQCCKDASHSLAGASRKDSLSCICITAMGDLLGAFVAAIAVLRELGFIQAQSLLTGAFRQHYKCPCRGFLGQSRNMPVTLQTFPVTQRHSLCCRQQKPGSFSSSVGGSTSFVGSTPRSRQGSVQATRERLLRALFKVGGASARMGYQALSFHVGTYMRLCH